MLTTLAAPQASTAGQQQAQVLASLVPAPATLLGYACMAGLLGSLSVGAAMGSQPQPMLEFSIVWAAGC